MIINETKNYIFYHGEWQNPKIIIREIKKKLR